MKKLRRKNPRQAACVAALESFGFLPTGRGMPTFFAVKHGGSSAFIFLARSARLKAHQVKIADVLHRGHVCVLIWTGKDLVAYRDFQQPPVPEILQEAIVSDNPPFQQQEETYP